MQKFIEHVKEGLSQTPKKLSSRYFYDAYGDAIFQQIMQLDAYYLPQSEMDIILNRSIDIAQNIAKAHKELQIIELGAGDGSKTKFLLEQFLPHFKALDFVALDISANILEENRTAIQELNLNLSQHSVVGNYFETFDTLPQTQKGRLVLFLGANIGNFVLSEVIDFFSFIKSGLKPNDYFLVAFDMVKHPRTIIEAYDDPQGITKKFNLNLLARMNRELGANFNLSKFDHFPFYNPITGITSSQIISLEAQEVSFKDGFKVTFEAFEAMHTEVSKKFFLADIEEISQKSQFFIDATYYDKDEGYAFVLFKY